MGWLQALTAELAITVTDSSVWLAIGEGLLFGAICLAFGVWVARFVGLLRADGPAGETLGVGLACGLVVLAAWWAAIASGGRSSLTPVAVGFVVAIVLAMVRRRRTSAGGGAADPALPIISEALAAPSARRRNLIVATLGGGVFIVAVALLYGSTLTLSPRDGVQPLEFTDEAYYSILSRDLAETGTETIYSPSGLDRLEGLPTQTWYHWGELWLGTAVISIFGIAPLDARHFVVLPLLVLAAASLTGTVVRRMTSSSSGGAFMFGFLVCLFLAPVAFLPGPFFNSWAVGLIFAITQYGLAAVGLLLAMYGLVVLGSRPPTWAFSVFAGSAAAMLLPAHVVIALLAMFGVGVVWVIRIGQSLRATRRLPMVSVVWRRTLAVTAIAAGSTVAWGLLTGHGAVSGGASPGVTPFNASWRESVAVITLGAGAFIAIPIALWMARKEASIELGLYAGTVAILITGAVVWGALVADIVTLHVFFAGIAVFATPAAAVAVWSIWLRLRAIRRIRIGIAVLVLCGAQLALGVAAGAVRLVNFGPGRYPPVPQEVLAAIRSLPPNAKLAYACDPFEELAPWEAQLLGIDAHTGHRIVPMCFEADFLRLLIGGQLSAEYPNPLSPRALQSGLYPDAAARPSPASVAAYLRANGIGYVYVDAMHPNSLIPDGALLAESGDTQVFRVP